MTVFDCKKIHPKCKARCCGIVPIPKELYEQHKDKMNRIPLRIIEHENNVIPITSDAYCPFLNDDLSCNIYEDRPEICRKFGDETHPMLCCPYLNKDGKERCRQSRRQIEINVSKNLSKLKLSINE